MGIFVSEEIFSVDVKERIVKALVQGKATTNQLQILLRDLGGDGSGVLAHELAAKILGFFTVSLSELKTQHPLPKHDCSGMEAGNKKRSAESKVKRGCYKRRKSSQTRTMVASTIEDNHAWRKYGQKEILNYQHPRSYFRCSHKHDQNCKAIKQVQKMEENPLMFEITYIDVHTCKDNRKAPPPQRREDSTPLWDIQSLDALSSGNTTDVKDDILFGPSSSGTTLAMVKGETKEDAKSDLTDIENNSLLLEAGDLAEGSSEYQGFGMDFLVVDDDSEISMFDN